MADQQWPGEVGTMPPSFRRKWDANQKKWAAFRAQWEREHDRLDTARGNAADRVVNDREAYNEVDREIAALKRQIADAQARIKNVLLPKRKQLGKQYAADRKANNQARAALDRAQRAYAIKDRRYSEANRRLWERARKAKIKVPKVRAPKQSKLTSGGGGGRPEFVRDLPIITNSQFQLLREEVQAAGDTAGIRLLTNARWHAKSMDRVRLAWWDRQQGKFKGWANYLPSNKRP